MSPFSFLTFETSHFSLVSWPKILSILSELWTEIPKASRTSNTQAHCRVLRVSFYPNLLWLCLHSYFLRAQRLNGQIPAAHLGAALLFPVHPQPSRGPLVQIFKFSHTKSCLINQFGQAFICSDFCHLLWAVIIANCLILFSASIYEEKVVFPGGALGHVKYLPFLVENSKKPWQRRDSSLGLGLRNSSSPFALPAPSPGCGAPVNSPQEPVNSPQDFWLLLVVRLLQGSVARLLAGNVGATEELFLLRFTWINALQVAIKLVDFQSSEKETSFWLFLQTFIASAEEGIGSQSHLYLAVSYSYPQLFQFCLKQPSVWLLLVSIAGKTPPSTFCASCSLITGAF